MTERKELVKKPRPQMLTGKTYEMITGCGDLHVTINEDEQGVFETFITMGKCGGCAASQCEAIGRMVSLGLRSGIPVRNVIKQLIGISCHSPAGIPENKILSCSDAIGKALQLHIKK